LIENRLLIREALRLLLEREGLKIVAETGDCVQAFALIQKERPHIALLNLRHGDDSGLELLERLNEASSEQGADAPAAKVVLLIEPGCVPDCRRAIALGAKGIVLMEQPASVLMTAIHRVCAGEVSIDSRIMTEMLALAAPEADRAKNPEKARIESLTPREIEVIQLLAEGLKNHQIAKRLFVSEGTVRHYLNRVFTKLDITDRSKLLIYAFRHGIAKPF
jgi:DNA-binding NarL/FixJ family response regulator